MANQEQLRILQQGTERWNAWRKQHREIPIDLRGADLSNANLIGADFNKANLGFANCTVADLNGADLSYADLSEADLNGAILCKANLSYTHLIGANLSYTNLREAKLSYARIGWTIFGNVNLRTTKGLEVIRHLGPSTIGVDTLEQSKGDIPEVFLRGAGLSDTFIAYAHSLIQKLLYYTCFISYSSKDQGFAKRLYADLQNRGVRCWFAPEDLKIGEKFWHRIDESIRLYDKLLVVLSQHSVESEWVEREVVAALEREQQQHKAVLFPIALDEAFKNTFAPWAADLRRQRHIGDFRLWKDHDSYQKSLNRLLRDLKQETTEDERHP
jgi:hypothetical protein